MIKKILCLLGFHEQKYVRQISENLSEFQCVICETNFIRRGYGDVKKEKNYSMIKKLLCFFGVHKKDFSSLHVITNEQELSIFKRELKIDKNIIGISFVFCSRNNCKKLLKQITFLP